MIGFYHIFYENGIVHGELDITKMPKDILDAFADAIIEEIEKMMKEDKL